MVLATRDIEIPLRRLLRELQTKSTVLFNVSLHRSFTEIMTSESFIICCTISRKSNYNDKGLPHRMGKISFLTAMRPKIADKATMKSRFNCTEEKTAENSAMKSIFSCCETCSRNVQHAVHGFVPQVKT